MTEISHNKTGTLVMYKLKEENLWWPAILYSSHTEGQPFICDETFRSSYHTDIFRQCIKEHRPENPRKSLVCVLGHPYKPAEEEWWYPVDNDGANETETKPLSISKVSEYFKATPEAFQDALHQTLDGCVAERMASNRVVQGGATGESGPNGSSAGKGSTGAAQVTQNGPTATNLALRSNDQGDDRVIDVVKESAEVPGALLSANTLKRQGWKGVRGGLLQDYLYLRPGVKKGEGQDGIDFFTNLRDALDSYVAEGEGVQRSSGLETCASHAQPRRLDLEEKISAGTSLYKTPSSKSTNTRTVTLSRQKASKLKDRTSVEKVRRKDKEAKEKILPPWHEARIGGRTDLAILKILVKLGFRDEGNRAISHPSIGEKRFSLEEIRRYMVQNHIGDFEKKIRELNKSDSQTLHNWCTYINLDHKVFVRYHSEAKVLTEHQVMRILQKLGFGVVSGDFYLPGADKNRLTRTTYSMSQLFEYCRSHEMWSVNDAEEVGIHSYEKFGVGLPDWVNLLFTMARVDEPILAFKTPSKREGHSKRRRESKDEPSVLSTNVKKSRKISTGAKADESKQLADMIERDGRPQTEEKDAVQDTKTNKRQTIEASRNEIIRKEFEKLRSATDNTARIKKAKNHNSSPPVPDGAVPSDRIDAADTRFEGIRKSLDNLMVKVSAIAEAGSQRENEDVRKEVSLLKKELRERQLACVKESDPEVKETLTAFIEEIKEEIAGLSNKKQKLEN